MDDDTKDRKAGWTSGTDESYENSDYHLDKSKTKMCNDGTRIGTSEDLIEDMLGLEAAARKRGDIQMEISARMHRFITAGAGDAMYTAEYDLSMRKNPMDSCELYLAIIPSAITAFASALSSFFISGRAADHGVAEELFRNKSGSKCLPKEDLVQMCELAARSMYSACAAICDLEVDELQEFNMDSLRKSVAYHRSGRPQGDGSVEKKDDNVVLRLVEQDTSEDTFH